MKFRFNFWNLYYNYTSFKVGSESFIIDYFWTEMNPHKIECVKLLNTLSSVCIWKIRKFKAGHFYLNTLEVRVYKCFKTQISKFEVGFSSAVFLGKKACIVTNLVARNKKKQQNSHHKREILIAWHDLKCKLA